MADFLKYCFPSAPAGDDEVELVSKAALPGSRRSKYNEKLKASVSRPIPIKEPTVPPPTAWPSRTNPYMPRRPSEDLQDLVGDDADEPEDDYTGVAAFNARDRAHGHVLRDLSAAIKHSKWAVSGSYAEGLWGCPGTHRTDTLSIMCSSASAATTKTWLTSQSLFTVSAANENILEYQGETPGSAPVSVRIRWVSDRELERLTRVEGFFNFREGPGAPVDTIFFMLLTLPALADNLALSWVKATDPRVKKDFAADLFAVLARIKQLDFSLVGAGPLSKEQNAHIMHRGFWEPFRAVYPESPALFAECGLPIPEFSRDKIVRVQPPVQGMMMASPPPMLPFETPDSFQKPRAVPTPSSRSQPQSGRSLTTRPHSKTTSSSRSSSDARTSSSSKPSSSSSKSSGSSHPPSSSRSSKTSSSHKSKHSSSSKSKSSKHHSQSDEAAPPSPRRPVHPANILPPPKEPHSKISVFLGLQESPQVVERRRKEKLEKDREAKREAERLAAQIQRNRVRDREREWHTRKQAERKAVEEDAMRIRSGRRSERRL